MSYLLFFNLHLSFHANQQHTGCTIKLTHPNNSRYIELSNPPISLEGVTPKALSFSIIDLPEFKSADLPSVEDTLDYPLFDTWIKPDENAMLNTTSWSSLKECSALPDFRNPLPYDERGSHPGTFPSIFGRSTDSSSGEEVVLMYDRHLTLYENTIENPVCIVHSF